ncbi:type II toxin-antitoxin system CcdA family antitoxin [Spiribacter halobius]|nr:type II toxin-antitoxin system CcdA family antitoxin [Spiribacter halobius]UEX77731.1 type II toxin-antitoxin system CcdA family antitoxin [Spiribacter halobius]
MAFGHDSRRSTKKRAVHLSLDSAVVDEARSQGINLSQVLEGHLREALRAHREQTWRNENRDAIRHYNERAAERGSFGDRFRCF